MSWRTVVISKSSKLDLQLGSMVVRSDKTQRIHISEISLLIIESTAVSLTAALLVELVKNRVKIIFCDEKRNPHSQLSPYYGSHDISLKIKKQIAWEEDMKKEVWTEIIFEKILHQANTLLRYKKTEAEILYTYLTELEFGDSTNREGHAAKVYFNALFGNEFSRRNENSINAALNYGYAIILSLISREVVSNGYLTELGLFHDNVFNQFNLSSDLIEPFRSIVDNKVLSMNVEKFETEEKHQVLEILNQEVEINGKKEVLINAVKIYVKSVFDALNAEDVRLIKFFRDEFPLYEIISDV